MLASFATNTLNYYNPCRKRQMNVVFDMVIGISNQIFRLCVRTFYGFIYRPSD